jgi:hypothetical protein
MCFPFADLYSHLPPKLDTRNSCRIRILPGPVTGVTCSLLGYDGSSTYSTVKNSDLFYTNGLDSTWATMSANNAGRI